jgi:predicted TIM-barrel fold metal-dependent hydrolase
LDLDQLVQQKIFIASCFDVLNKRLYSVDYPFDDMTEAVRWFDQAAISEPDRLKIARSNAQELFHL